MTCSKWISTIFQAFCHTFCGAHANFGQTGNNRALITLKNEQWPQLVPLNQHLGFYTLSQITLFSPFIRNKKLEFCVNVRQTIFDLVMFLATLSQLRGPKGADQARPHPSRISALLHHAMMSMEQSQTSWVSLESFFKQGGVSCVY